MPKSSQQQKELDQAIENFRQQVVQEELLARLNKASYEKMYYYINGIDILPKYDELTAAAEKKRAEINTARQTQGGQILDTALDTPFAPSPEQSGSLEITTAAPSEE